MKKHLARLGPKLPRYYAQIMSVILLVLILAVPAMATDSTTGTSGNTQGTTTSQGTSHAGENMWDAADCIIRDVYTQIAGISTVLAGLMSAVAVVGAKVSNNQHKTDQAWDWLKRIWIAWAIINGMGAFLAYIRPLFDGLATLG